MPIDWKVPMSRKGVTLTGHESLIRLIGKRRRILPSFSSACKDGTTCSLKEQEYISIRMFPPEENSGGNDKSRISVESVASDAVKYSSLELKKNVTDFNFVMSSQVENWSKNESVSISKSIGWVECPVCGKSIQEKECIINKHLDLCLSGGLKRKKVQLSISQFGLTKGRPKHAIVPVQVGNNQFEKSGSTWLLPSDFCENNAVVGTSLSQFERNIWIEALDKERTLEVRRDNTDISSEVRCGLQANQEKNDYNLCLEAMAAKLHSLDDASTQEMCSSLVSLQCLSTNTSSVMADANNARCLCLCHSNTWRVGSLEGESTSYKNIQDASLKEGTKIHVSSGKPMIEKDELDNRETLFTGVIETHIVGRKYHLDAVCKEGMRVRVVREPDNPKDPHAIKVIPPDSSDGPSLGHLPRNLAFYLSTLLDREIIQIKGVLISIPDQPFEPIPLRLFCESQVPDISQESQGSYIQDSWTNAVRVAKIDVRKINTRGGSSYQQNFLTLLKAVLERESHLFSNDEKTFLGSFYSLSGNSQRLLIRLYQRKGPWFQLNNISYEDIANVESSADELVVARFMTDSETFEDEAEVEVLKAKLKLLTAVELKQLISASNIHKKSEIAAAKRHQLVDWAVNAATQNHQHFTSGVCRSSTFQSLLTKVLGRCVRVTNAADLLFWRLQRLFFLNGGQELSSFLLVDMGRIKYPSYNCIRTRPVFLTREAFLAYEEALEVAQVVDMAVEVNDMQHLTHCLEKACTQLSMDETDKITCYEINHAFLQRFSAPWIYTAVCTLGVSVLERERRYDEAVKLLRQLLSRKFCPGRRGHWTVRLSVDLEHLGRKEESLQVAEIGVTDDTIRGGDRVALQRRVIRLGKPPRRWKKPAYAEALERKCREVQIRGRPLNSSTGARSIFYDFEGNQCTVEELALQYYAGEGGGWKGVHSESGIWITMFGLLMWDVLFADIADVFQTPFQTAPLDLGTDAFYLARKPLIESRLESIFQGKANDILTKRWTENYGTSCRGVNWEKYSLEELQTVIYCIKGPELSAVCQLLAEDYAGWSAGMPDLLLWRMAETTELEPTSCCRCKQKDKGDVLGVTGDTATISSAFPNLTNLHSPQDLQQHRGEAKLVEVKGPNDRLSEQQRAWIACLMTAGLSVEVCKVLEQIED